MLLNNFVCSDNYSFFLCGKHSFSVKTFVDCHFYLDGIFGRMSIHAQVGIGTSRRTVSRFSYQIKIMSIRNVRALYYAIGKCGHSSTDTDIQSNKCPGVTGRGA